MLWKKDLNNYFLFLSVIRLLDVTTAIKKNPNIITSFLIIKPIRPPISEIKIISLNHFCPDFNSSFVCLARMIPIKYPITKTRQPIISFTISCMIKQIQKTFYILFLPRNSLTLGSSFSFSSGKLKQAAILFLIRS